jgi:hypothetical protein
LLTLIGDDLSDRIAIMEPTGVNYQLLWGTQLARVGVEVRLFGHKELRSFREHHLGLPDKDDDADALALAIYGWDYLESPRRFVQVRSQPIVEIRGLVLRLSHLNRVQSPIINLARQDLAWQFPEATLVRSVRSGEKVPQFLPYRKVFARFGFGRRVEVLLLSQIYPFENYLAADGKPDVKIRNGRLSDKATKRHLSLRGFCKSVGYAPSHSRYRRHQQVESQRRFRFVSNSFVAVDIYQD